MSKGNKIVVLLILVIASSQAFVYFKKVERPEIATFFSFVMCGCLIAMIVVALSRGGRPGR
jgi:uncharacterized integral membrane protein